MSKSESPQGLDNLSLYTAVYLVLLGGTYLMQLSSQVPLPSPIVGVGYVLGGVALLWEATGALRPSAALAIRLAASTAIFWTATALAVQTATGTGIAHAVMGVALLIDSVRKSGGIDVLAGWVPLGVVLGGTQVVLGADGLLREALPGVRLGSDVVWSPRAIGASYLVTGLAVVAASSPRFSAWRNRQAVHALAGVVLFAHWGLYGLLADAAVLSGQAATMWRTIALAWLPAWERMTAQTATRNLRARMAVSLVSAVTLMWLVTASSVVASSQSPLAIRLLAYWVLVSGIALAAVTGTWSARRVTHALRRALQAEGPETSSSSLVELEDVSRTVHRHLTRIDALERLRDSEDRMRLAAEATGFGTYDFDPLTGRAIWSVQLKRMLGLAADAPEDPAALLARLHPDDRDFFLAKTRQLSEMATATRHEMEYRFVGQDGEIRWMHDTAHLYAALVNSQRRIVRVVGTVLDVTARKRTEAALWVQKERLRLFIEHAPAAVAMFDANMRYLACSRRWLTDYSMPAEVVGRSLYELFPELPERAKDAHQRALAGEVVSAEADPFPRRDGTTQYITWDVRPWRDIDGTIGGVLLATEDVTVRVASEKRLRESEAAFRTNATRQAFLLRLNDELRDAPTAEVAQAIAARALLEHLEADRVGYVEDRRDADAIAVTLNETRGLPDIRGVYRYDEFGAGLVAEFNAGRSVVRPDVAHDPYLGEDERAAHARLQTGATIHVPILEEGVFRAGLFVHARTARQWSDAEVALAREVAERSWNIVLRLRTDEALLAAESRFREIADRAPMMVWMTDATGACEFTSRAWQHFTGQSRSDALGWGWLDVVHDDDRPQAERQFRAALAERVPFQLEYRVRRADGTYRWMLAAGAPRGPHTTFEGYVGSVLDISERREIEHAIRTAEERFRLVADQTPIVMWVTDATGQVEFVNDAYCEFFGVTLDDVTGSKWQPLVHPDDAPGYVTSFADALRHETLFRAEARVRCADGEWRWIASYGHPRRSETGAFIGIIGISPDVTDQRLASELEREAARQKDEFIAVLAHELRNPLAPIRTAMAVLRARGASDPALMKCRDIIDRQVTQMARLLDDLLDVSRLSRGRLSLQRELVRLRDVVEASIETSRPAIDDKRHTLTIAPIDPALALEADPARLTQVLANLLNNAAKYTKPGGAITLDVERRGEQVVIDVSDTGIGIEPGMRERIFDLFAQVDAASQRSDGGLGIGLGLTKRLVEMHGGTIAVDSAGPGRGATFTVVLPLASRSQPAHRPEVVASVGAQARTASHPRVLIVDDNADAADTVEMLLEELGCTTRTVYDGEAAITHACEFRPDLVLLDLGMPGLDGHAVCRRLRQESWGANAIIAAVTGWGQDDDRRRTRITGFDHHFVKPVDPEVLAKLVRELPRHPLST